MYSSPARPPQRTYGRRANGKRPPPRPVEADSESDTDTEDAPPARNTRSRSASLAASRSRSGTPAERSLKRARTSVGRSDQDTPGSNNSNSKNEFNSPSPTRPPLVIQPASLASSLRGKNNSPSLPADIDSPSRTGTRESTPATPRTPQGESQGSATSATTRRAPRRMLSKAQSMAAPLRLKESTSTPPATPRPLRASQSMPVTPGSIASDKTSTSLPASPSAAPAGSLMAIAPGSPSTTTRAKRTYGRNRTFLAETETEVDAAPRESYAELRKRYEVDNEDTGEGSSLLAELQLARAPEPISDMRSKGESKRFADEISYLLGGLSGGSSRTLARTSALEVLNHMENESWAAKLAIHGETERIFEALLRASAGDEVMDAIVLLFLATLKDGLTPLLHVYASEIAAVTVRALRTRAGPLDAGYKGKASNTILQLRTIATKLRDGAPTTRGAASLVLVQITTEAAWPYMEYALLSARASAAALASLVDELSPLSSRLDLYSKGLELTPADTDTDMTHIQQCLRALASIVTLSVDERGRLACSDVQPMLAGTVVLALLALDPEESPGTEDDVDSDGQAQAARSTLLALEFLTPLAGFPNMHPVLAAAVTEPGFLPTLVRILVERQRIAALLRSPDREHEHGQKDYVEDIPYLILALFGEIIDVDGAAGVIADTAAPTCGKRACTLLCRCPSARKLPAILATQYAETEAAPAADGAADQQAFVAYLGGYLAFLLAQLLRLAPSCRKLIEPSLPGATWGAKVAGLIARIKELARYRDAAHDKMRGIMEATEGGDGEGREGKERTRARANTPGGEEEKLAEAVRFLEDLA